MRRGISRAEDGVALLGLDVLQSAVCGLWSRSDLGGEFLQDTHSCTICKNAHIGI